MIISLRKLKHWTKFFLLFTLFTLLLYQIFSALAPFFKPEFFYKEPSGGAVKVIARESTDAESRTAFEDMKERLLIFYWIGE